MNYYLEYIFLENLLINIILINQINIFTKQKSKKIRILISCLLISMYTTLIVIFNIKSMIVKILEINVAIYLAFKPNNIKLYFKLTIYYILFNFMYVSIIIALTIFFNIEIKNIMYKLVIYLISGIILFFMNKFLWKIWKANIKKDKLTYIINIKGQEILAFVDTGNMVRNFEHNLDVIFIDKKYYYLLKEKNILVNKIDTNINSIIGKNKIEGYIVENIEVYKRKNKVSKIKKIIISFSEQPINIDGKYNALIGYNTYLECLEGVKL